MIIKEITNRRSIREYKADAVSEQDVLEIIRAAQFAPSAKNNHAIEFVVVRDQTAKDKLCEVAGQEFVKKASVLVALVLDTTKTPCPIQDVSAAAENMLLQAVALGLGAVWKNVRPEIADRMKAIIGIPENFLLNVIVCLGYPNESKPSHADAEFDQNKVHNEKW